MGTMARPVCPAGRSREAVKWPLVGQPTTGMTKPRPSLPGGPYLVVGLARSGQAAARLLAGRGEQVAGCDSGSPEGAEGLGGAGVEVHLDTDGVELLEGARCLVKSPGVPREAAVVAAAAPAGDPGDRRAGAGLAAAAEPLRRGDRDQRQDDRDRAARPCAGGPPAEPVAVAGNVGTPARLAGRRGSRRGDRGLRVLELPAGGLRGLRARVRRAAQRRLRTTSTATGDFDAYLRAKLRIFANQGNDDVAVYNALRGGAARPRPRRLRAAGGYCRGADPDCQPH